VQELAHVLGRQLDRRQGVLDLVRDRPRHLGPRRELIASHEARDVVEQDERSCGSAGRIGELHADDAEAERSLARGEVDLERSWDAAGARDSASASGPARGRGAARRSTPRRASAGRPDRRAAPRRRVDGHDAPGGVGRQDAGRCVAEQRLDVVPAPDEIGALPASAPAMRLKSVTSEPISSRDVEARRIA